MKKASPLKSAKKSMASFMTARLSSARCEGGPGNPPLPTLKTEKEREKKRRRERERERERVENGQASLATLWQHLHRGQRIRSLVIFSWFRHPQCKMLTNQITCACASCWENPRGLGTNSENHRWSGMNSNALRKTVTNPTSPRSPATKSKIPTRWGMNS